MPDKKPSPKKRAGNPHRPVKKKPVLKKQGESNVPPARDTNKEWDAPRSHIAASSAATAKEGNKTRDLGSVATTPLLRL